MSATEYRYTPLGNGTRIRLLRLYPAEQTSPVRISILDVDLDQHPLYEALSYTWGSASDRAAIICNGDSHKLSVTRNCEAALRRLRFKTKERMLWIDAICIDQNNTAERGLQVQLMSSIYRQAQRVIAYLGEASHNSDVGMDFVLEDAASITKKDRPSVGLGQGSESSPQQKAIEDILARPYFKRCWIIQEIVFAKDIEIVLGDRTVNWNDFSQTMFYFGINKQLHLSNQFFVKPPPVVFYRDRSTSLASGKTKNDMPQSLLEFLRDTRRYEASDPRDKVIALLGMSTEKDESALTPNYAMDTGTTFLNLVKYLIYRDRKLDILCHVQEAPSSYNLASWVPDWTVYEHREVLGHKQDSVRPYKASIGLPAEVFFQREPETLVVKGKIYDTVSRVGPEYQSSPASLREWETLVAAINSSGAADTGTLFMDTLIAYPPYRGPNAIGIFYPSWRRQCLGGEMLDGHGNAQAAIFREHVDRACIGRSLFVTEKGLIGLGPTPNQRGHVIAVLLGGSVPFVLRREGSSFLLVGECYVHGLMNGEAVQEHTIDFQMIHII